ncbi:MAG: hypothetical protein ACOWWH_06625 [Eubacteriaceae bacterium]
MTSEELINAKKELKRLQSQLGQELVKGKHKDIANIRSLKNNIKNQKIQIGNITKNLISQL